MSKIKQLPLIPPQAQWFHIFKSMVMGGDAAKLGGTNVLVYLVIKTYCDWSTGRSFPSAELIAEKAGLSERQVIRCLKALREAGYVEIEPRAGKRNIYKLREKIEINNEQTGEPDSVVFFDYAPSVVKAAQAELRNFLITGSAAGAQVIKIETLNLTVNVQNIAQGDGIVYNIEDIKDPGLRARIQQVEDARRRAKEAVERERSDP